MSISVLERVEQAQQRKIAEQAARKREAGERFASLVTILADGGEEDAQDVLDVLTAVGKTVEELSAAVEFRVKRLRAAELLRDLPTAEARVTTAADTVGRLEAERRATIARFDGAIAEAKSSHKRAVADLDPFHAAHEHLTNTAADELQQERRRISSQAGANRRRLEEIAEELRFATDKLERGLVFANVQAPVYDKKFKHYYSAADRAALTSDRYEWVGIEAHAREQVERTAGKWDEWLAVAAARGVRPTDTWDRGAVVKEEQERRVREIVQECRSKWQAEIDKLNAEASALRRQAPQLEESDRATVAAMLIP